ncbi:MAG: hypothetical protein M3Z00_13320 [Actinomycetota bacterium]|nr:hypothetical protein [Actinomycetota bacterium]
MKRTTAMTALIAAAALMLAGCSKNSSGTPSAGSAGAVAGVSSQEGASAAPSAGGGSSQDAASTTPSAGGGSSQDAASTSESASSSGPKQTIGGGAQVDADTLTWFTVYCGGMSPVTNGASAMPSINPSAGPDAMKKSIGTLYKTFGDAMTNTATKLKDLPPPSFSGGDKFATTSVAALSSLGKIFEDGAAKIQAASPSQLPTVMTSVTDDMSKATKAITGIYDNIAASPDLLKVFSEIPACKKLGLGG